MKQRVYALLRVWVGIGALSMVVLQAAPVQGLPLAPMAGSAGDGVHAHPVLNILPELYARVGLQKGSPASLGCPL